MRRRAVLRGMVLGPLAGLAAGCADLERITGLGNLTRVAVSWSAAELAAFQRVLGERAEDCLLIPLGDDISAALGARTTGRPDVVALPQPRLVERNRDRLAVLPARTWHDRYERILPGEPSGGGHRAVPFKLAHASVVWYRRSLFAEHGLTSPRTWSDWLELNQALVEEVGVAPLALGGADGWLLARFFENVLLRHHQEVYDRLLRADARAWADPRVRTTFRKVADMWGRPGVLAGGPGRALVAQFPDAVLEVFGYGRAAMVPAPDFAESVVRRFGDPEDVDTFTFPAAGTSAPLVISGDLLVLVEGAEPAAVDLVRYLSTPRAPVPWIRDTGGFIAANPLTDRRFYSRTLRRLVDELDANEVRFGLSDQLVEGGALQSVLQDLLRGLAAGTAPRRAADEAADAMRSAGR